MITNCPLCGRRLSVEAIRERKNTIIFPNGIEVVICEDCGKKKKELEEKVAKASPRQIKVLKTKANESLIDAIQRESKLKEQKMPIKPTKKQPCPPGTKWSDDVHQCVKVELKKSPCPPGKEWNDDLHQCVKIVKPTPKKQGVKEQIPAQPVVPVGPVTIEQKVAALTDEVAQIKKLLANLYGFLGRKME